LRELNFKLTPLKIMHHFSLTHSISDKIFKIGVLYGRISSLKHHSKWLPKLAHLAGIRASIAAVSVDKDIFERIDLTKIERSANPENLLKNLLTEHKPYTEAKQYLRKEKEKFSPLSLNSLNDLHNLLIGKKLPQNHFRKNKRLLPKQITENGVAKTVNLEVVTTPYQIPQKLQAFLQWFNNNNANFNPVLLAAVTHFRIAEIHPYDDGNGRLCRLLDYFILAKGEVDVYNLIWLEYYFLLHSERYYQLIETTITSQNLTDWIEFYTDVLLNAFLDTAKVIYNLTGGAVDIKNNVIYELSELEMKVIELMRFHEHSSPTQMAKLLGYSKQNICRVLKELADKELIKKSGKNTGVRYKLL
jgi:Fic family protein